jgi:hypothetical protein
LANPLVLVLVIRPLPEAVLAPVLAPVLALVQALVPVTARAVVGGPE